MTVMKYMPEIQEVISSGKKLNVLVVDDTRTIRSAVREVLELGNIQVIEAENGIKALDIIAENVPDLVLLDTVMPEMDGITVIKTIRKSYSKLELPVVIVAKDSSSDIVQALDSGANDYITKPVDFDVLWARLSNQLMQKQAAEYLRSAQVNLEKLVKQRTEELNLKNRQLKKEIDIRVTAEDQLQKQANFDELTGLPNRNLARDRLYQTLLKAKRYQLQPCLAFLDLDNFKYVNDTFGHAAGDELLKQVSSRLSACARKSDTVARLGGDEFLLILDDSEQGDQQHRDSNIRRVGDRIIQSFSSTFKIEGQDLKITPSLGFAVYPQDGEDSNTLMRHADAAMYRSKNDGKNKFCFYSPDMSASSQMRVDIEAQLRRALERKEFSIQYQPIVDPENGNIVKAEALLRWNCNSLGTISPGYFIPIAEESGLIIPIGEWVITTVCHQVKKWRDAGWHDMSITINVSASQFHPDSHLVETIKAALKENSLPADAIQLELTEGVLLKQTEHSAEIMKSLEAMGIKLLIDDFGTGYASLTYLQRYNFDSIKIDRSYIKHILTSEQDLNLVKGIIAMAKILGMSVVSEGVENKSQLDLLMNANCEFIQGYFFSKPVPPDDFLTLLQRTKPFNHRTNKPAAVKGAA